jgi:hypothetical protein
MLHKAKRPPAATGGAPNIACLAACNSDTKRGTTTAQLIPPRATLARRFPRLRVNRLSGKWCDDQTGERGDDTPSLLAYLARRGRL